MDTWGAREFRTNQRWSKNVKLTKRKINWLSKFLYYRWFWVINCQTLTTAVPVVSIGVLTRRAFCVAYSHLETCCFVCCPKFRLWVVRISRVIDWKHFRSVVKSIGEMWFVHCIEVVCISEGPLLEVSQYNVPFASYGISLLNDSTPTDLVVVMRRRNREVEQGSWTGCELAQ